MTNAFFFDAEERFILIEWLVCMFVLSCFCIYSTYAYFHLKDPNWIAYIVIQIGAMMYLTATKQFFNLLPLRIFHFKVQPGGTVNTLGINLLFEHLGVVVIFWGLTWLTRGYLNTKRALPVHDRLLNLLFRWYAAIEMLQILAGAFGIYLIEYPAVVVDNVFILAIIATIIATCIIAHKRAVLAASHFLAANILPMLVTAVASVYVLIYDETSSVFTEIAIFSQIIMFGLALMFRLKSVNDELAAKAIEAVQLGADIREIESRCLLIEQENKHIEFSIQYEKDKNRVLEQKLGANQRELTSSHIYIHQKNKLLAGLKTQIQSLDGFYPNMRPTVLKDIQSSINGANYLDAEWDKFKLHFEQVHPLFFEQLQAAHPALTKYELRLHAYFHMNLSTKEISTLLNIAPASVRRAKTRLYKKMKGNGHSASVKDTAAARQAHS